MFSKDNVLIKEKKRHSAVCLDGDLSLYSTCDACKVKHGSKMLELPFKDNASSRYHDCIIRSIFDTDSKPYLSNKDWLLSALSGVNNEAPKIPCKPYTKTKHRNERIWKRFEFKRLHKIRNKNYFKTNYTRRRW